MRIPRRAFLQSTAALALRGGSTQAAGSSASPYRYTVADGGFEILNGPGKFNRPLPPSRSQDAASRSERLVCWAGDRPEVRFTALATRAVSLGELHLSVGGKPLEEFQRIHARYTAGSYEYRLSDPSLSGEVKLSLTPATRFEGLIVKLQLPSQAGGKVAATVGPASFEVLGDVVRIRSAASKRLLFARADARFAWTVDGDRLRGTQQDTAATVYLWFTSDDPGSPEVLKCAAGPASAFEASVQDLRAAAAVLEVRTPDPFLDAIVAQQNIAIDRAWHETTMMHGVYSWHVALAGWRILYGATVLGQHDRVHSHIERFFAEQVLQPEMPAPPAPGKQTFGEAPACRGAIPGYLGRKSYFYNMGEVLLDMALYDWQWTGGREFIARAFDPIARKLAWQDHVVDPDGDGLYENWLNAWNTDSKWHNGGGGIIASVYTWRASLLMADIARRLGRDPAPFQSRADKIREACDRVLWVPRKGVYAEYQDALGLQRLHEAPDQSSVYTPIDLGFCDDFQAYQMLRFTEYAIPGVTGLPRGGELLWSSNWPPQIYSTFGLYADETVNTILCYFRLGLAEKGYALLKGMEATACMGACPGSLSLTEKPDGSSAGHIDFTDIVSMFLKTVVDGLFGLRLNVPAGVADIQPAFPAEWEHASMRGPVGTAEYRRTGATELLTVTTAREVRYRFRMPARAAEVRAVTVDGRAAGFTIEPGVGHAWIVVSTPSTRAARLRIDYGEAALPRLNAARVAAPGAEFSFSVTNGTIREIRDPQNVTSEAKLTGACGSVRMHGDPGWHTFFVRAENRGASLWLPVDCELRPAMELVEARRSSGGISAKLRNNTQSTRQVRGELIAPGLRQALSVSVPALGAVAVAANAASPALLSPGTNTLTIAIEGGELVEGALVDWTIPLSGSARPVPLGRFCNQDLATLHQQRYVDPHTPAYTMTVQENGRSWWLNRVKLPDPRLDILRQCGGLLKSAAGVPFEIITSGPNACFTSRFKNFPLKITIPVAQDARKLYFLLAASTNQMQSRIENARITVHAAGGPRILRLINPDNLDDWLTEPFATSGCSQPLGPGTWGRIVDIDLETRQQVVSVELECLSNEVLVGLCGLTLWG